MLGGQRAACKEGKQQPNHSRSPAARDCTLALTLARLARERPLSTVRPVQHLTTPRARVLCPVAPPGEVLCRPGDATVVVCNSAAATTTAMRLRAGRIALVWHVWVVVTEAGRTAADCKKLFDAGAADDWATAWHRYCWRVAARRDVGLEGQMTWRAGRGRVAAAFAPLALR